MTMREEWPKAAEAARMLARLIDDVVPRELPGAIKSHGYWHAGSIAGEKGSSLFVGRTGRWRDSATDDGGDLIDLIAAARGISLSDAYQVACVEYLGFAARGDAPKSTPRAPVVLPVADDDDDTEARNIEFARRLWRASSSIAGTPADVYLRTARGITGDLPSCLRFHPACPRGSDERLPAMVAAMVDIGTGIGCGIHRTFLRADGAGKIEHGKAKMMLGRVTGAAIKLTPDAEVTTGLGICEGIETGLSLISSGFQVWAVGTAGAIKAFPVLAGVDCLTIFADNDPVGIKAAEACAERWADAGQEALTVAPKSEGQDWNDWARQAA